MTDIINRTGFGPLLTNVSIAVLLCLIINSIIFGFGFDGPAIDTEIWFAPPGWLVGTVWVILFALIGLSRYLLNSSGEAARGSKNLLVGLLLFCLAYPIYTIGFNSEIIGFLGNIATIAFTIFAITKVWGFSKQAALLLVPIVLWVSFATVLVTTELHWI